VACIEEDVSFLSAECRMSFGISCAWEIKEESLDATKLVV